MEIYFDYLLKSSLWIMIFYLVHHFFLQKESFHGFNRAFLLAGIVASIVMPFVTVHYTALNGNRPLIQTGGVYATIIGQQADPVSWKAIALISIVILYITASAVLIIRVMLHLVKIVREILKNKRLPSAQKIIYTDLKNAPFSFGQYIFMPKDIESELEQKLIIRHESAHIRQLHYLDLWLSRVMCIIQFYNPFMWLYAKAIQVNCEFIADRKAIEGTEYKQEYIHILLKHSIGEAMYSVALHFSYPLTLKRITTMKQKKSKRLSIAKSLMVVPMAGLILVSYAQPRQTDEAKQNAGNTLTQVTVVGYGADEASAKKAKQQETTYKPVKYKNVYRVVEVLPKFGDGGTSLAEYLASHIKYPVEAQKQGAEGRVICQFVVDKEGNISEVHVIRGVTKALDEEAIRVVKAMPRWTPGYQGGKPVNVLYTLPITFKLH
ncbi:M56 family metallopeptidase [Microbacter margulisiae]|uniref:TonB family protein n=1 Tax=Microbacter margulisiae TaxID=1350067 RepID=A0A7W5H318_9PORP|nr:M56 family metallopeptidase [Microbacter margulisiae]MBB3188360.1 TonB family protein [Microbacter margulisiae]